MINLKLISISFFLMAATLYSCGVSKHGFRDSSEFKIEDFEVDKTGNYYLITKNGEIRKFSSEQKLLYTFKNYSYGDISAVDVTNPHKILIFYKDFQSILGLDNTLSTIFHIKLDDTQYFSAIGSSNDGNIWIYNSVKKRIIKISYDGMILDELPDLPQPHPQNIADSKIFDRENRLFIPDNNLGLLILNNLGYFEKLISGVLLKKPEFSKNTIYFYDADQNSINSIETTFNQIALIKNLGDDAKDLASLKNGKLYMIINNNMVISE